jgi:hypothetical protein
MGVVDRPDIVLVIEFDFAPICEAFVAQRGLDAEPLFGTRGPVGKYMSGEQDTHCHEETKYDLSDGRHMMAPRLGDV